MTKRVKRDEGQGGHKWDSEVAERAVGEGTAESGLVHGNVLNGSTKPRSDKAYEKAIAFLNGESIDANRESLHAELVDICEKYVADEFVDELAKQGQIKERLTALERSIYAVGGKIEDVGYIIQHYQRMGMYAPIIADLDGLDIDIFKTELGVLHSFCKRFSEQRFSKKGSGASRVFLCCWSLWKLREELTGRDFRKIFGFAPGATHKMTGTPQKEFDAPDARFVQILINEIDPKVQFKTIRRSLQDVAKRPPGSIGGPLRNSPFFR